MKILIIDDDAAIRDTLGIALESNGFFVVKVADDKVALSQIQEIDFAAVFLDLKLGNKSGLDLLPEIKSLAPETQVILMTAYGSIPTAVQAIKLGAFDYITKPFKPAQARQLLQRALQVRRLEEKVRELEDRTPPVDWRQSSKTAAMQALVKEATKVASSDVSVLLLGESGTGKSALARFIHEKSPRYAESLVTIHCPSLSHDLLESDLFGYVSGAFTGATQSHAGKIAAAEGGTLFLDEIGELPLSIQPKLLRLLQERQYERVGDNRTRHANIRVIAATNRDLKTAVAQGSFREDLYFRLNVVPLQLSPLRERREEILPLARQFVQHFARLGGKRISGLSETAAARLENYFWPGNMRELCNAMERAVIFSTGSHIEVEQLPSEIVHQGRPIPSIGGEFSLEEIEAEHTRLILSRKATIHEASRVLKIDPTTLLRKRRKITGLF